MQFKRQLNAMSFGMDSRRGNPTPLLQCPGSQTLFNHYYQLIYAALCPTALNHKLPGTASLDCVSSSQQEQSHKRTRFVKYLENVFTCVPTNFRPGQKWQQKHSTLTNMNRKKCATIAKSMQPHGQQRTFPRTRHTRTVRIIQARSGSGCTKNGAP